MSVVVSSFYVAPREYMYKITPNCSTVNVLLQENNIIKVCIIRDLLELRCENKGYIHKEQVLSEDDIEYILVSHCTE
jgi:hypothetical protein